MSLLRSILLCAGRGERLRPLTDQVPKPALPIAGVPLGAWGLRCLAPHGPILVNASHLAPKLVEALRPFGHFEVLREEPEPFGTAGTLAAVRERVVDRLVTYNGDLLSDLVVEDLLESHEREGRMATLAVRRVAGEADLEEDGGRVTRLIDRRVRNSSGARFMGVAVWEKEALSLLPGHRPIGLGETLLPALFERGELAVHVHGGYALDVGTPARYRQANQDVAGGIAPPVPIRVEIL